MGTRSLGLLLAVFCLVLAGCSGASDADQQAGAPTSAPLMEAPGSSPLPESVDEDLSAVLEAWLEAKDLPGVTAAVVTPEGFWAGAAGVDGAGTPLVPESAMAIASITKTFTAAEVMLLSARGLVDLDAPVTEYVELPFDARGATVRQLLSMSSGFPNDPLEAIDEAVVADLEHDFDVGDDIAFVDPDATRMGSVGYGQEYNNVNYGVLGEMIEQVTDRAYAEAVRADLLDHTDLTRVWLQDDEQPEPPLTVAEVLPQVPVVDPDSPWLPSRAMASIAGSMGGIASDAPTVARWGALLYGGHVIDGSLVEQMTAGQQQDDDWYGLGTFRGEYEDQPWVGHLGQIVSYHGKLIVFPDTATSIAYFVPAPSIIRLSPVLTATDLSVQLRDATIAAD
jgi:D-alanyl-D-alanine carboxypeptidase